MDDSLYWGPLEKIMISEAGYLNRQEHDRVDVVVASVAGWEYSLELTRGSLKAYSLPKRHHCCTHCTQQKWGCMGAMLATFLPSCWRQGVYLVFEQQPFVPDKQVHYPNDSFLGNLKRSNGSNCVLAYPCTNSGSDWHSVPNIRTCTSRLTMQPCFLYHMRAARGQPNWRTYSG